ncbi:hypothetical protein OH809_30230 [Streptomyces sp. NBC_00873]|uniref:trypsin-like serine peptidase n=1 Tax=Streptomyces sp. NBC_00873 TaxID=2975852 RepID=UPI00386890F3|nr:hypothetical protein OH809_30230 [Streptomyces sp. NBC_00873]
MNLKRIAVTAACTSALLSSLLAPAAVAQGQNEANPGVAVDTDTPSAREVAEFWTPERTREALAHPEPLLKADPKRGLDRKPSSGRLAKPVSVDAARPTSDSPAARTATLQTAGTEAAVAQEITVAQEVPYSTSIPNVVVGKLLYQKPNGDTGHCTASVIVSDTKNTVWTAGHCVHTGSGGAAGWFSNIRFIPGYKDGQQPWGEWVEDRKYAPSSYTEGGDQLESDLAAVVLQPLAGYGNLQDNIGGLGYRFGGETDYADAFTVGYPGEGYNRTDMTGERMMYCRGNTEDLWWWVPTDDRVKMDCDMGKGASGGPMFIGAFNYNPQIIGANSHYQEDATTGKRVNDDLISSLHDLNAANVINAVNDSA